MNNLLSVAIQAAIEAGNAILEIYQTKFEVAYKSDLSPLTLADQTAHEIIVKHLESSGIPILSEEGKAIPYAERKNWEQLWIVDPLDGTKEFVKRNDEFTVNIALIRHNKPIMGVIYTPVLDELYFGDVDGANKLVRAREQHSNLKEQATPLPLGRKQHTFTIVASRSHQNPKTQAYIAQLHKTHPNAAMVSKGSSLKLCMIAEGTADIYPRFAPTSEWDIAAGHAIINASGGKVCLASDQNLELLYNKQDILNPWFIAAGKGVVLEEKRGR